MTKILGPEGMSSRLRDPVVWAQIYSASVFVSGPISAGLVVWSLTPRLQGFYYTFGSLVAVLTLFEFGGGAAIAQILGFLGDDRLEKPGIGDRGRDKESDAARIYTVGALWNRAAVAAFVVLVGIGGFLIVIRPNVDRVDEIFLPWSAFVLISAIQALLVPSLAVLQARQYLSEYWFNRFVFHWAYTVLLWALLLGGLGLWSLAGAAGAGFAWSVGFLAMNRRRIAISSPRRLKPQLLADTFRRTVWPLQWRLGLSWFSVTFTLTWLTSLAMLHSGPVAAGQTGLTVALGLVIFAFNTNWLTPIEPKLAQMAGSRDIARLRNTFRKSFWRASVLAGSLAAAAVLAVVVVLHLYPAFSDRILPAHDVLLLILGVLSVGAIRNMGSYCRAHCVDPCAVPLAVGSAAVILAGTILGSLGTSWVAGSYAVGMTCIALPWSTAAFWGTWIESRQ